MAAIAAAKRNRDRHNEGQVSVCSPAEHVCRRPCAACTKSCSAAQFRSGNKRQTGWRVVINRGLPLSSSLPLSSLQAHALQGASNASALETSTLLGQNAGGQKLARTRSLNPRDVVHDLPVHKLSLCGGWIKRRLVVTKEEVLICSCTVRSADLRREGTFGNYPRPACSDLDGVCCILSAEMWCAHRYEDDEGSALCAALFRVRGRGSSFLAQQGRLPTWCFPKGKH